jgi:hypothetical protein
MLRAELLVVILMSLLFTSTACRRQLTEQDMVGT